jgi:hypothetical protein
MDWSAVLLPLVLVAMWGTDLTLVTRRYQVERDARAFRNFLRSLAIALGVVSLFVRALAVYIWPAYIEQARFFGFVVYGALFVIGGYELLLWWRERRERQRD